MSGSNLFLPVFFLYALGAVFLIFASLETGLKIDGFSAGCEDRSLVYGPCKHLSSGWLIVESRTDDC